MTSSRIDLPNGRRGLATVELTMALPVLVFLFALIFWVSTSLTRQSEALVAAREKVWEKRTETTAIFQFGGDNIVVESDRRPVRISPVVDGAATPTGRAGLFTGSWDYRKARSSHSPNYPLHMQLIRANVESQIVSVLAGGADPYAFLEDILGDGILGQIESLLGSVDALESLEKKYDLLWEAYERLMERLNVSRWKP